MRLADRVDRHAGGELWKKVSALLWHHVAGFTQFFQCVKCCRLEKQGDLISFAVNLLHDLSRTCRISLGDFLAGGESWLQDFVDEISLQNRDVELSPPFAL